MIGSLFSTKSIWLAQFFWIPMWKAPFFWHPGICTYFSLRDFSRLLILLVLHELTVIFVQQPAENGYKKKSKGHYIGQHLDDQVYEWVPPPPRNGVTWERPSDYTIMWNKEPKELLGGVFGDTEFWDNFSNSPYVGIVRRSYNLAILNSGIIFSNSP